MLEIIEIEHENESESHLEHPFWKDATLCGETNDTGSVFVHYYDMTDKNVSCSQCLKIIEMCAKYTAAQQRVQLDGCPACGGSGEVFEYGQKVGCIACEGTGKRN